MAHWHHLPAPVRPYFVRRVCVFGPESTGKSTLARRLAEHFDTVWVPEFAREWLEVHDGALEAADMPTLVHGQTASEDALARQANRLLVCDTDPLTTSIWSDVLYGQCAPAVQRAAEARRYDLYLLCDVDVPWVDDVVRYLPDERASFFTRCVRELEARDRPYTIVRGDWEERWEIAVTAIEHLLAAPEPEK
jgi:NadR type nicotinamide-nucleotide adenylyltransferase